MAVIKNTINNKCWQGWGWKKEPLNTAGGNATSETTLKNNMEAPYKTKHRSAI
jgi:hypothetical protein